MNMYILLSLDNLSMEAVHVTDVSFSPTNPKLNI